MKADNKGITIQLTMSMIFIHKTKKRQKLWPLTLFLVLLWTEQNCLTSKVMFNNWNAFIFKNVKIKILETKRKEDERNKFNTFYSHFILRSMSFF